MGTRIDRALELLVVWLLSTSALGLAATLAGHFLAPQIALVSVLLVLVYAWRTRASSSIALPGGRPDARALVVILLVSLFFRLPAANYVLGGQDEGLYVNIAHYIEHTGGIRVSDGPLQRLRGSGFTGAYLAQNREGGAHGIYLAGVYLHDGGQGASLQFQFYHLFPVWMALFIGLFGSTFGVYALTLFALAGVLFMYRLALVMSGSQKAALFAGLLLAVSPLHVFFSKFPVTEIPTLAFSLAGFTFLAAFWRNGGRGSRVRWLALSASCFGALFFTRISGFMYVPFFVALAMASAILDEDRWRQRALAYWSLTVVGLYVLSVAYGWHWSYQYAHDIYAASFRDLFGNAWKAGVALVVILASLCWAVVAALSRSARARPILAGALVQPARLAVGVITALALLYGSIKIYRLGWTTHYVNDPWLSGLWHLSGLHWHDVWASSLFALVVYMGLFIPVLGTAWLFRRRSDPMGEYLRVFVAGFFVYVAVLQWVIPYGPYYTRYLLSELVPYMTLFVVVGWSAMTGRSSRFVGALLVISMVYMGCASAEQLGKQTDAGLYASLRQLVQPVDSGDVILLDSLGGGLPDNSEIKTPLLYTFHKNVISISRASLNNKAYVDAIDARYDDVYLISPRMQAPAGFESLGSSRIKVWDFMWTHSFPHRVFEREDMRLYLYRLVRPILPLGVEEGFVVNGDWNDWLKSGWSESETWGTWSLGDKATLEIDPRQLPAVPGTLRLQFKADVFVTPTHPVQHVQVSLDGSMVGRYVVRYPATSLSFGVDVPDVNLTSAPKITIGFVLPDAISPKAAGVGADPRVIALGLVSVTATAVGPEAAVRGSSSNSPQYGD